MAPERDASRVATRPLAMAGAPAMAIDGTERRRPRPTHAVQQQEQYSGTKTTPTAQNLLLVNEHTDKGLSLGPIVAGKKHDKQAADEEGWPIRPMPRSTRTRACRAMSQREC